ncbi:DinB family protein [Lysobacter solisilvae (ex Woo and Kim 2020)]|uniref:DinB family protein n=1 Tax=Agrilutibacter terrestris TaxID=2865112 RepID=A0A7H0FUI6_9GAMM|nr:DinB family protein [Lysobacter terrestris]QNP39702.1 DinB family protein [Lysobacter terrestris]
MNDASIDTTLQALAAFPAQLAAHYAAVPAGFARWAPPSWDGVPSERFTALEQVLHVRDIEIDGYHVRFRRTLHEPRPVLADIDSYALAAERGYAGDDDVQGALVEFRVARTHTIELLSALHPDDWARPAEFEGYGPVTVRGLMHYLCSHDQQHLAGLQWLLGQIAAAHPRPL